MTAPRRFGEPREHHDSIDSTNRRAKELAAGGAPSGTVVTAAEQTSGRGRGGRRWVAPSGAALLYSAILRPLELVHLLLPLAVPLAVCEACESLAPVECRVKWPNDIWVNERKLAGVLIESRPPEWAVIGVGINLSIEAGEFPRELRWPAVSLGAGVTPARMGAALDAALGDWTDAPAERVLAEFGARDALAGCEIEWQGGPAEGGRRGAAEGIDERGNLLVRTADGPVALGSGEVHLLKGFSPPS